MHLTALAAEHTVSMFAVRESDTLLLHFMLLLTELPSPASGKFCIKSDSTSWSMAAVLTRN
jgi:hypothetical protein